MMLSMDGSRRQINGAENLIGRLDCCVKYQILFRQTLNWGFNNILTKTETNLVPLLLRNRIWLSGLSFPLRLLFFSSMS